MQTSLVIIPTYNEVENITAIINKVFGLYESVSILVVDDNSPDKTATAVETLQKIYPNHLFLLKRKHKNGLGRAYVEGFKWALAGHYQFIFQLDADFSHNPEDLILLYNACIQQGADIAVGSRYINGVTVVNWPISRIILSYGASKYVRLITGMPIKDPTAGFVCYNRTFLQSINLNSIKFVGYAFQIEMKFKAFTKGFKIIEIPILFKDRVNGKSKMSGKIISEAIFGVIYLKFKSIFNNHKYE